LWKKFWDYFTLQEWNRFNLQKNKRLAAADAFESDIVRADERRMRMYGRSWKGTHGRYPDEFLEAERLI